MPYLPLLFRGEEAGIVGEQSVTDQHLMQRQYARRQSGYYRGAVSSRDQPAVDHGPASIQLADRRRVLTVSTAHMVAAED